MPNFEADEAFIHTGGPASTYGTVGRVQLIKEETLRLSQMVKNRAANFSSASVDKGLEKLAEHLPKGAYQLVAPWFDRYPVVLRISRPRRTKLGDFRSQGRNGPHRISVNRDLGPYSFLITLVHEFAHVVTFAECGRRAKAHGKEWKANYRELLYPFLLSRIFPADLEHALHHHLEKAPAASCSDPRLVKALHAYDDRERTYLEQLPINSLFSLGGERLFRKGEKLRKRYRCVCLNNQRTYLIDPLAEVDVATP